MKVKWNNTEMNLRNAVIVVCNEPKSYGDIGDMQSFVGRLVVLLNDKGVLSNKEVLGLLGPMWKEVSE